ncbi:MAG: phosphoribosyl-AMP cyclohydrolase [Azospirillaceae bacterium]|nr:phosphoribosyl-AMP cyclohydrolase [Azospirillaceae bacterium]
MTTLETNDVTYPLPAEAVDATLAAVTFDANGLVPAIAQQFDTGEVLMMAWMNHASIAETLATGRVCYWSRSRQSFWRKGDTSGQVQHLKELRVDCDGDTLLLLVDQTGVACHTGRRSCFYRAANADGLATIADVVTDPLALYPEQAHGHGHSHEKT